MFVFFNNYFAFEATTSRSSATRSSPASHRAANSASNLSRRAWQRFGVLASVLGWMSGDFRTRTRPRTRRLSPLRRSLFLGTRFYVFFYFAKPREISLVLPLVVAHTYIKCLLCVSAAARLHSDVTSRWQFWPPFAPNFKFYVILLESDQQCRWSYGVVELASLSRAAAASRLAKGIIVFLSSRNTHMAHIGNCVFCVRGW